MEMEFMPEFTDRDRRLQIVRGKRTKRPRPCSPVVSECVSSSEISTEEDEDMANCLIMLAQSVCSFVKDDQVETPNNKLADQIIRQKTDKLSSKSKSEMTTKIATTSSSSSGGIITKAAGLYVYECKTCNRTFPSFQALGGHRASHKKPKLNVEEKKSISVNKVVTEDEDEEISKASLIINNNNNVEKEKSLSPPPDFIRAGGSVIVNNNINNKAKVHECSICGSEFSSGQALGGHMRKHRPILPSINRTMINEEMIISADEDHDHVTEKSSSGGGSGNNMLSLDLNFPPPELVDDHVIQSKSFQFTPNSSSTSQQQRLIFSSPALVDCHY
uniref:zinc finger protein ZAT5-like n=1 Tax=Erigeron canadensis TaxID=72917 RepID=UPI001CB8B370|nr:zinc finger protein ZAT5-like [Erigeron canadensis]